MHSPAEHSIEGELRDAEAHIVHRNIADPSDYVVVSVTLRVQDTDRTADQALTVMLDKFNGKPLPYIQPISESSKLNISVIRFSCR